MLRTDLSSIESLRSLRSSVQILLYWFLESVLDRSVPEQNVRRLLRNCDDGRVGVAANDAGHHRCIDDTQTFDAENPKIRVDDAADGASARRMIVSTDLLLNKCDDVGLGVGCRNGEGRTLHLR